MIIAWVVETGRFIRACSRAGASVADPCVKDAVVRTRACGATTAEEQRRAERCCVKRSGSAKRENREHALLGLAACPRAEKGPTLDTLAGLFVTGVHRSAVEAKGGCGWPQAQGEAVGQRETKGECGMGDDTYTTFGPYWVFITAPRTEAGGEVCVVGHQMSFNELLGCGGQYAYRLGNEVVGEVEIGRVRVSGRFGAQCGAGGRISYYEFEDAVGAQRRPRCTIGTLEVGRCTGLS